MGRLLSLHLRILVGPLLCFVLGYCIQFNETIDDTLGDLSTGQLVTYTPPLDSSPPQWTDQTCQKCAILPSNSSMAYQGSFHAATYDPSAAIPISFQLDFTGTAIYVFFTLVNNVNTFVNFTVDNTPAGFFAYNANTNSETMYQVPVFSSTDLQYAQHSLRVSATPSSLVSYLNFDFAQYTEDDEILKSLSGTPSHTSSFQSSSSMAMSSRVPVESKSRGLDDIPSGALSTFAQLSTTTFWSSNAANPAPTASSTSGLSSPALRGTGPTHLAIIGAVVGSVSAIVATGLLLRFIWFRNQSNPEQMNTIISTEARPEVVPHDLVLPVPPPTDKLQGRVSALLSEKVIYVLRRTRQTEIDQRLQTLRAEIVEISSKLSARGAMVPVNGYQQHAIAGTGEDSTSSERLRRMLSIKRRQIEHLEKQRQSPWARGFMEKSPLEDAGGACQ